MLGYRATARAPTPILAGRLQDGTPRPRATAIAVAGLAALASSRAAAGGRAAP